MEVTSASSVAAAQATPPVTTEEMLGKDDFLRLLVAQMQHQDPLNPMDNQQFVAQLAQFSSLEQIENLANGFETFASSAGLGYATSLIGMEVAWVDTATAEVVSGTVDAVHVADGSTQLRIGEEFINLEQIMRVQSPAAVTDAVADAAN